MLTRSFFLFLALFPTLSSAVSLEGKWQSNGALTCDFNNTNVKLTEVQQDFLAQLMGYMTLEFHNGTMKIFLPTINVEQEGKITEFTEIAEEFRYEILAEGKDYIVIRTKEEEEKEAGVITYHFENENTLWVYVPNAVPPVFDLHIREYFSKIEDDEAHDCGTP